MSDANLPVGEKIARAIEAHEHSMRVQAAEDRGSGRIDDGYCAGVAAAARIARETSPWTAVGDGLPDWWTEVLIWGRINGDPFRRHMGVHANPDDDVTVDRIKDTWRNTLSEDFDEVTHWSALVPSPTGGGRPIMTDETFEAHCRRFREESEKANAAQMAIVEAKARRIEREEWERSVVGRAIGWLKRVRGVRG